MKQTIDHAGLAVIAFLVERYNLEDLPWWRWPTWLQYEDKKPVTVAYKRHQLQSIAFMRN
jgi:hypothetical protein